MRVALKVETIREDLGKVGNVIALQIEEAMVGHRKELDTAKAENEAVPIRKMLSMGRKGAIKITTGHGESCTEQHNRYTSSDCPRPVGSDRR